MQPGQLITLSSGSGTHLNVQGQSCEGVTFTVISLGVGAIYVNQVRCETCGRDLECFGNRLVDPLAETLMEQDESAAFGVKVIYRFHFDKQNGTNESVARFFADILKAQRAYDSFTREAVRRAFRPPTGDSVLESAKVKLQHRGKEGWEERDQKEFHF